MQIFLLALVGLAGILVSFDIFLSLALLILFFVICIKNKNEIRAKEISIFLLIFLAFFIRSYISINNQHSKLNNISEKEAILVLTNPIVINGDYLKTTASLDGENVQVAYTLNNKEEKEFFENNFYGGKLKVKIEIKDIAPKKNFYSFDYKFYQNTHAIYKQVVIKDIQSISTKVDGIINNINIFRTKAIKNIDNNLLFNESGYFQALIYGDKSNLENDDKVVYADLGISHLLAISGLHVATLLSIIYYILGKIGLDRKIKEKIVIVILPLYSILAGFAPSVVRAVSMILVYIIFRKLKLSSLYALMLVFLTMIFINPYYIFDIGFQFSFFITFTLLMSSDYIMESANRVQQAFKVSLISGLASLPITVHYFNNFSFITILSNLIFVPFFTVIIFPLVLISYVVFTLSQDLFNILFKPLVNFGFYINDKLLEFFAYFPNKIIIAHSNKYLIYFLVFLIIASLVYLNRKQYKSFALFLLASFSILFIINQIVNYKEYIEEIKLSGKIVHYIRNKDMTMLINTSNNYPDFQKDFRKKTREYDIMNEYQKLLDYEGMTSFDYLVLSKTSSLEIGQATNLVGKGRVRKLLILENIATHKNIVEVLEVAKLKNVQVAIIKNNEIYDLSGIKLVNTENEFKINFKNREYIINKEKSKN